MNFCGLPFRIILALWCFVLFTHLAQGLRLLGETCFPLIGCEAENSHCVNMVCRCKPGFPVALIKKICRPVRYYRDICDYIQECQYYDKRSSCYLDKKDYKHRCGCNPGYMYDFRRRRCVKLVVDNTKAIFSAVIIVISSLIGITLVCCMLLKFCHRRMKKVKDAALRRLLLRMLDPSMHPSGSGEPCLRMNPPESNGLLPRMNSPGNNGVCPRMDPPGSVGDEAGSHRDNTVIPIHIIPPQQTAARENPHEDLPPSYEEVIQQPQRQMENFRS